MISSVLLGVKDNATTAEVELTTDEVFHLLSNERRRHVIHVLMHAPEPLSKREVGERVAAREYGTDYRQLNSNQQQTVRISLHQNHLPRLVDKEVIEEISDGYTLGPNAGELAKHLENDSLVRRLLPL